MFTSRVATQADLPAVVETITTAFHRDPVWSWVFPDEERRPDHYRVFWRFLLEGGLRYPWVRVTQGCEATAMWIPPGGSEQSEAQETEFEPLVASLVGDRTPEVMELMERFGSNHPHDEPHYYLALLGTHDDHRGKGLGMALLSENLERIDALHMPAYLESSNDENLHRYQAVGFEKRGEFSAPNNGPTVTTMWRTVR